MNTNTNTAANSLGGQPARLFADLTFPANRLHASALTLPAGSVVEAFHLGDDTLVVCYAGWQARITIDDAEPVEWDADFRRFMSDDDYEALDN